MAEVRATRKTTGTRGRIISRLSYIVKKEFTKPTGFLKTLNGKKRKAFFSF